MLRIQFQVTQQDIDQGRTGPWCPIELALIRQDIYAPRVYPKSMRLDMHGAEFPLPQALINWIDKFDSNEQVSPFTYNLEVPDYAAIGL